MSFPKKLYELRIQKGLSQKRVAALDVCVNDLDPDWSFYGGEIWEDDTSLDELGLLQDYRILNDNGKGEARKRVNELTEIPKYKKGSEG